MEFSGFRFLGGFLITSLMPWPYNTVVRNLDGAGTVATSMNGYQLPEWVAVVLAILLPLVNELSRLRKGKSAQM